MSLGPASNYLMAASISPAGTLPIQLGNVHATGSVTIDNLPAARALATTNVVTPVVVNASAPPTGINQALITTSTTNATWQSLFADASLAQMLYVNKSGNDTTGDGSIRKPYLTISQAINVCGDSAYEKRYTIHVGPGDYSQAIHLPPWVFIVGDGYMCTRISGAVDLVNSRWGDVDVHNDKRSGASNVSFTGATTFDFTPYTSDYGKLYFCACWFNSVVTCVGHVAINQLLACECIYFAGFAIAGMTVIINACQGFGGNITITNAATAMTFGASGGFIQGNVVATNAGGGSQTIELDACPVGGTVTLTGANIAMYADVVSLPKLGGVTVGGGATLSLLRDTSGLEYVPTTPAQWATLPVTAQVALDRLAGAVYVLRGNVPI